MTRLEKIAEELSIPVAEAPVWRGPSPSEGYLRGILSLLATTLEQEGTLIGGTVAQPFLSGKRKIDDPSHNLAYIATENAIRSFHDAFADRQFKYDPRGFIFMHYDSLQVRLMLDHVHSWEVTPEFYQRVQDKELTEGISIPVGAPEYTVMLKIRRAEERRQNADIPAFEIAKPAGPGGAEFNKNLLSPKDAREIASMLIAPKFRDVPPIDYSHLGDILFRYATTDVAALGAWSFQIRMAGKNFTADEEGALKEAYSELRKTLSYNAAKLLGEYEPSAESP